MHIFIEGNIGCGKSTLISHLRTLKPGWVYHPEPVEDWQNQNGRNALEDFYHNPEENTFSFQKLVLQHFSRKLEGDDLVHVWERSALTTTEVFSRVGLLKGHMTQTQFDSLTVDNSADDNHDLHHHVYLRTSPARCLANIRARDRTEESSVTLDYLISLHLLHEDLFKHRTDTVLLDYNFDVSRAVSVLSNLEG